jgi:hypothetical protein
MFVPFTNFTRTFDGIELHSDSFGHTAVTKAHWSRLAVLAFLPTGEVGLVTRSVPDCDTAYPVLDCPAQVGIWLPHFKRSGNIGDATVLSVVVIDAHGTVYPVAASVVDWSGF